MLGARAADVFVVLDLGVLDPLERVEPEPLEGIVVRLALALLLGLLEALLELVEDVRRDLVGLALELQVAGVTGRDRAGREGLASTAERQVEIELRELVLALALERAGEGDLDRLAEVLDALGRDVDSDVELAEVTL